MSGRKAVVDVGTNSVKFCAGEIDARGTCTFLADTAIPARLGAGLRSSGRLSEESLERSARAIATCVARARELGADDIAVIGTAAVRAAENAAEFRSRVMELSGQELCVLPGEEEARLSYEAVLDGLDVPSTGTLMTMDTGGGSTEFVFAENRTIARKFSVPVGAVLLTEQYRMQEAVSDGVLAQARVAVRRALSDAGVRAPVAMAVGLGGGVTGLAAAALRLTTYRAAAVHGTTLSARTVERLLHAFAQRGAGERTAFAHFPPGRADIILAGACIVKSAMELSGASSLTVSAYGLRHALLRRMLRGGYAAD